MPRYKCKNIAALDIALGGLPAKMRVEADVGTGVSAKTVGELRKGTTWPENLVITTPRLASGLRQADPAVNWPKAARDGPRTPDVRHEAAGVHHPARRRGGRVAARGGRAAGGDAGPGSPR